MDENIGSGAVAAKDAISNDKTSPSAEPDDVAIDNQDTTRHHSTNHGDDSNTRASTKPAMVPQGPPPLEELASQPIRTHRNWTPKYGRVQKCDWCNGRSAGTLQVCSSCSLRMCEDCARTRKWHSNRSHFIDADACDWSLKKPAKNRGTKRAAPIAADGEPRRKTAKKAKSRKDDEDDNIADDDDNVSNSEPSRSQVPSPSNARDGADHRPSPPSATRNGHTHASRPSRPAQPDTTAPATESPRARPSREAAARAIVGMSELARRSSGDRFDEDGEEDDDDYEDEDDNGESNVVKKKGVAEKVNDPLRRRGNPPARNDNAGSRPLGHTRNDRERTNSPQVGALGPRPLAHRAVPTPEDIEHDQIILDIHDWIYGTRPNLDPRRARTQIPDSWAGDWQAPAPHYGREASPYGYNVHPAPHYPPPGYGQYPVHMAPPPPIGYPPQPCHPYQEYAHNPGYGPNPAPGPAPGPNGLYPPPTAPSNMTPTYHQPHHPYHEQQQQPHHPYHEQQQQPQQHNPAELEHARQDRQTLDEMINAWMHNPLLLRLANHENRRVYAIGLLWDVLEVRRMVLYIRNDSQTVRWFVNERDRQFRIQHSAPAFQGYQQQQQMMMMRAHSMTSAPAPAPVPVVRGQTPVPVRGVTPAPVPVMGQAVRFVRGQTPVGFHMPAGHMQAQAQWAGQGQWAGQAQWAGMPGHVNQAEGVHQAEADGGADAHSENATVVLDDDGNNMVEEE